MAKKKSKVSTAAEAPKTKPTPKPKIKWVKVVIPVLAGLILIAGSILAFEFYFLNRIYPGISINNVGVGGLTVDQARQKILSQTTARQTQPLVFNYQSGKYPIDLSTQSLTLNLNQSLTEAFDFGHHRFYLTPVKIYLNPQFDSSLDAQLTTIKNNINQQPVESQLQFDGTDITVTPSQEGLVLNETELKKQLADYLATGKQPNPTLPMRIAYPKLSYAAALNIKTLLDKMTDTPLKLTYHDRVWTIDSATLLGLLDLKNSQSDIGSLQLDQTPIVLSAATIGDTEIRNSKLALNSAKLDTYLKSIAADIDQPVKEPLFQFDGTKVTEFQPPTEGVQLDIDNTKNKLVQSLTTQNLAPIALVVKVTPAKNKLTNDLGIKELIAEGVSNFAHSIPNRIFNVGLAASRVNGVIIPPGETFSFVKTVGDISGASGYKQGYIIKDGRTVLDDGGGVCQVSTTIFRAALNAGLPIVERTAHAYRVGYYEQGFPPGLDATIFSPSVDFKFKNDTPANILIQTKVEGTTLTVDFYGTSDGRVANVSKPVILSTTPALPDIRQDDPTLPRGTTKQVDFAVAGANVVFNRTVTRNGETLIKETFRSNYRPWQNIYLIGTKDG